VFKNDIAYITEIKEQKSNVISLVRITTLTICGCAAK